MRKEVSLLAEKEILEKILGKVDGLEGKVVAKNRELIENHTHTTSMVGLTGFEPATSTPPA